VRSEQSLLAAARQLDPEALAAIHGDYYQPIYRYISFRIDDPLAAEDLTSEVFTRLLEALGGGKAPRTTLRGWLFGVAANVVSDYHRHRYRVAEVELSDAMPDDDTGPLGQVERALNQENLVAALVTLTEDQQAVIGLRYGSGLSVRETAKVMGKSEGAIKQLQARAVASLARTLVPEGQL
jgi:RNA polymerase sigma-70 factor (ECF subfamily)